MNPKKLFILILVAFLLLSLLPYKCHVNYDFGIRIYQSVFYAVAQKRDAGGEFTFSHIYWFPESFLSSDNLVKRELSRLF